MNAEWYMSRAMKLAEQGAGFVSPNPMVGAVIVKDGKIIGEGYHRYFGGLHAEREALAACTETPKGATMYVTLEPCCHYGKQPPCVEAIVEAKIRHVVVGAKDANPMVAGKGIAYLREHGIRVTEHVLEAECRKQNEVFFHFIRTKKPFVILKYAMTLDGKIATATGASKWITGEKARAHVQTQRHRYSAIMVGVGTVIKDNPLLTCRMEGGRNPVRIICDTHLKTPLESQIVATAKDVPTILATCCRQEEAYIPYQQAGCCILPVKEAQGHVDINHLLELLGEKEIDSVIIEGGGTLNWSVVNAGIVNKVQAYISPKFFGGKDAKTPVEGRGVDIPSAAFCLAKTNVTMLGDDILVEGEGE